MALTARFGGGIMVKKLIQRDEQKISVKIWQPLIATFNEKVKTACLRRDPFLASVLTHELPLLDLEISVANSVAAEKFVAERLDQMDRKLVSLALPPALTAQLNDICTHKRIVRDAFFNRVFFLLAAQPRLLDALLFPEDPKWRIEIWSEYRNDGPLFQNGFYPLEPEVNPFWALRTAFEVRVEREECAEDYVDPTTGNMVRVTRDLTGVVMPIPGIYSTVLEVPTGQTELLGLSCFLPDSRIPDTPAAQVLSSKLDQLLASLEA
jgi:hypothetical protein